MIIIFARHGQTENGEKGNLEGVCDSSLTLLGKKQAFALAVFCKKNNIKNIYSSPLGRSLQTAQIIADECGLDIILDERLRELCFGKWEEKSRNKFKDSALGKEREKKFLSFVHPGNYKGIKGESYEKLYERVLPFLEKVRNEQQPVVVISHMGVIRCVRKYFENIDETSFKDFRIPNDLVYIVDIEKGNIKTEIKRLE